MKRLINRATIQLDINPQVTLSELAHDLNGSGFISETDLFSEILDIGAAPHGPLKVIVTVAEEVDY